MSEEIKNSAEGTTADPAALQAAEKKKKKVNKLTTAELVSRISDHEKENRIHSTYYKHLVQRKKELKLD